MKPVETPKGTVTTNCVALAAVTVAATPLNVTILLAAIILEVGTRDYYLPTCAVSCGRKAGNGRRWSRCCAVSFVQAAIESDDRSIIILHKAIAL